MSPPRAARTPRRAHISKGICASEGQIPESSPSEAHFSFAVHDARGFGTSTRRPSFSSGVEENCTREDEIVDSALRIADLLRIAVGAQK